MARKSYSRRESVLYFATFMKRSSCAKFLGSLAGALLLPGLAHGADVQSYSVAKGHLFTQNSPAAPSAQLLAYVFAATVEGDLNAITAATISPPSGLTGALPLDLNSAGTRFELRFPSTDLTTLGFLFSDGSYSFVIDSDNDVISLAQLSLTGAAFPTAIPQLANFDAAQNINASASFTLNWNALGDASRYVLTVTGDEGEVIREEGIGSSFVIPAGTLAADSSYTAQLQFVKESRRDTTMIPGATGIAGFFNETEFTLSTSAGNGGGGDTTPPFLFLSSPASGAVSVTTDTAVRFTFSEPMAPLQSIQWSANVTASSFSYSWDAAGRVLTATYAGGFPQNATITWLLNPTVSGASNFRDVAGNLLPSAVFQGSFTTGSGGGSTDPCNGSGSDDGRGYGSVFKALTYVQTGNAAPVLDPEIGAALSASFKGASNQNVTAVSLSGPAGMKSLMSFFGFFLLSDSFNSPAALEVAYPSGNYMLSATGAGTASVSLGVTGQTPIPRIDNFSELTTMNAATDFTLRFAPFTGAGANDRIQISISGGSGDGEFEAPDLCRNRPLPNTATSVVIPANTFKSGATYSGTISFFRSGTYDTNAINGVTISSGISVSTQFEFTIGGGNPPSPPRWTTIRRNLDGTLTFTVTADAGARLLIEGTGPLGNGWTPVNTVTAVNGSYELTVDPSAQRYRLFRATALP